MQQVKFAVCLTKYWKRARFFVYVAHVLRKCVVFVHGSSISWLRVPSLVSTTLALTRCARAKPCVYPASTTMVCVCSTSQKSATSTFIVLVIEENVFITCIVLVVYAYTITIIPILLIFHPLVCPLLMLLYPPSHIMMSCSFSTISAIIHILRFVLSFIRCDVYISYSMYSFR